jgi:hypothetical protein
VPLWFVYFINHSAAAFNPSKSVAAHQFGNRQGHAVRIQPRSFGLPEKPNPGDYLLQHFRPHTAAELAAAGLTWETEGDLPEDLVN